jgi:uncharacterized membrane protein
MSRPLLNRVIFSLALFGLMIAAFLWMKHSTPDDIPCGVGGGCSAVAKSRYSQFPFGSGPPVAAYGTIGYVALAILAFLRSLPSQSGRERLFLTLIVLGAGFGTLASLGLTYLELFKIHAICKWCMASQAVIAVLFILAAVDTRSRPRYEPRTA